MKWKGISPINLSIDFPLEIENELRRRAAAAGQDLSAFVSQVVTESLAIELEPDMNAPPAVSFRHRLETWIALHPVRDRAVDDSRDSIYAGRGE